MRHIRRAELTEQGVSHDAQDEQRPWAATVDAVVRQLPTEQRTVVALAYFERRSQSEIAGILGLPARTVARVLAAALGTVGRALSPSGGGAEIEPRQITTRRPQPPFAADVADRPLDRTVRIVDNSLTSNESMPQIHAHDGASGASRAERPAGERG